MPRSNTTTKTIKASIPISLGDINLPSVRELSSRLRFNPAEGRIWLDDRRVLLMHAEAFSSLRNELIASLGWDTARGLLTRIGYAAGCRDAQLALRMAPPNTEIDAIVRSGAVLHALQGYVLPEVHRVGPTGLASEDYVGEWLWKNSLEDDAHLASHGVDNHAACWMEVGYSSGFLSTCAGRRILVREVECRAQGTPHCRVIAKPATKWEDAEEDLRFLEPQAPTPGRVFGGFRAKPASVVSPSSAPLPAEEPQRRSFVGASAAFHVLRHQILRVAPTNATVLLTGESGVGKSLVAREIHTSSRRTDKAFVEINCAALPETLVESELFGVERGAYSGATSARPGRFEAADGGTLFLDEIGTLSLTAQGKLLRVLQTGELERLGSNRTISTDVRVLAATNEDLRAAVQEGRFREDLFYRLNVFPLVIQPLRDRREDIPLLVEVLLERFSRRHGRTVDGVSHKALRAMLHHQWPGNVRELENVLERAVILAEDGEMLDVHHLRSDHGSLSPDAWLGVGVSGDLEKQDADGGGNAQNGQGGAVSMDEVARSLLSQGPASMEALEDALVQVALEQKSGNVSRAARLLGLTRAQMEYRVKKRLSEQ